MRKAREIAERERGQDELGDVVCQIGERYHAPSSLEPVESAHWNAPLASANDKTEPTC